MHSSKNVVICFYSEYKMVEEHEVKMITINNNMNIYSMNPLNFDLF